MLLKQYDRAWERQRQEGYRGANPKKVRVTIDNLKRFTNLSVACFREVNQSSDSSSFSSDDDEVTKSPTGVSMIHSAGPGECHG